jgi:hypothetical protein
VFITTSRLDRPVPWCPWKSWSLRGPVAGSPGPGSSPPRPRYRGILLRRRMAVREFVPSLLRHCMDVWEFVPPMLRCCMDVWESARREVLYCRSRAVPRLGRIRMLRYRMDVWEFVPPMLRYCMDVWELFIGLVFGFFN